MYAAMRRLLKHVFPQVGRIRGYRIRPFDVILAHQLPRRNLTRSNVRCGEAGVTRGLGCPGLSRTLLCVVYTTMMPCAAVRNAGAGLGGGASSVNSRFVIRNA